MTEDRQNPADADNAAESAGGEVARDPDAIQREIEQTRAELAETIDEIADRISPRRAAARGAGKVRSVFSRDDEGGSAATGVLNGYAPTMRSDSPGEVAASGGAAYSGTTTFTTQRTLRTDRVLIAIGAAAAVTALVVLVRSRKHG